MPTWLIKLFHSLGRKQAAKVTPKREGITQIPTTIDAEGTGASFYTMLREAGFSDEALTKLIKSEQDIIRLVNKVESIQNQKLKVKKGAEELAKKPPFQGFTPTIVKDKTLFKDSPERIAKMKADNKAALERLKNKKKTVEDFSDDGDFDPGGMASGGLARVGMAGGGILKEFIEKLFIKASNDIRQGKGLFKGLTEKQRIVQHDNLTKLVEQFQKTGKFDKKANEYFGIDAEKAFADAEKQVLSKPTKTLEGLKKEETIDISNPEVADEFTTFIKESDPEGYKKLEQQIQLDDFDVTGRKKNASGGIAGQLHLNRPGYSGGTLVKLFNLLKGLGKQGTGKYVPYSKDYRVDMKKLMQGDDPIKLFSGQSKRQTNTMKSFKEDAKLFKTTPEKIAKGKFKDQWFTPYRDYAEGFYDPSELSSTMRSVELTPKEIAMTKRYVKKMNKLDIYSMKKLLGLDDPPKINLPLDDNTVMIPRIKLKKLKEEGRLKTEYRIPDKIKKKLGLAKGGIAGQLHLNQGGRAKFQTGGNSLAYVSTPSNYRPMPSNLTYEQAVQWNKEEKNRQEALSRAQYQKMQAMTDPNFQIDYDKFQQAYDKGLTKKYGQMDWVQDYSPYELYDEFYIDPDTGAKKKNIFTDFDNMGAGSINRYEDLANRLSRNTYGYWNEMGNQLTDPTYVSVRDNLRDIIASDAGKQMITYKDSNREPGWQPRTLASIAEGRLSDLTAAQRNKLSRENSRRYDELMVQTQPGYARNVTAYNRRPGNFLDKALAPGQSMDKYLTQAGDLYGLTTDQLWNYNPSAYKEVAHTPKSKAINVMMDPKGNVMKDQSMAELARETGMAPGITNLPINNMSDMQRMIGPGESIAEGTAYNPLVDPRMQAAADKGMDARMGRTYAENKQIMADKRMLQAKGGLAKILGV